MTDTKLHKLIDTYIDYVRNLRLKIQLNQDGHKKLVKRRRQLAVLEGKLILATEEMERRTGKTKPEKLPTHENSDLSIDEIERRRDMSYALR